MTGSASATQGRHRQRFMNGKALAATIVPALATAAALRLLRTDLALLAVNPNATTIIEGVVMVSVLMLGAFVAMRGRRP